MCDHGKTRVVRVQLLRLQFLQCQSEIDGDDRQAIAFALDDDCAFRPYALEQFAPTVRCRAPEIEPDLVDTKEPGAIGQNYASRLDHSKYIAKAKLKLAKMLQRAWKEYAVIGVGWQNAFAVGQIAKKRRFGFWLNVDAMDRS